jgi:hypothetical protein
MSSRKTGVSPAQRLGDALDNALELLAGIRYCEWPALGLGIGANPEEMDEILEEGGRALNAARRAKTWTPPKEKH